MLLVYICALNSQTYIVAPATGFSNLVPITRISYIYVNKDVRIREYFTKPKAVREQKRLGNIALEYWCENLSPSIMEEYKLDSIFYNAVMKTIFGTKREGITLHYIVRK
jgi:hypothetical protein